MMRIFWLLLMFDSAACLEEQHALELEKVALHHQNSLLMHHAYDSWYSS